MNRTLVSETTRWELEIEILRGVLPSVNIGNISSSNYDIEIYEGLRGPKGQEGKKGESGKLNIFNVSSFPPPVIIPNSIYFVGKISENKTLYTTDEFGNISQQINSKNYRFFNSNNEQIG